MPVSLNPPLAVCCGLLLACGQPAPEVTPTNQPVRIISQSNQPSDREPMLRLGPNCPRDDAMFSVRVGDPDPSDSIRAIWFIDPNDRYVITPTTPVFLGNPGTLIPGTDVRLVSSPSSLRVALPQFADGKRHRVEVVVADGDFFESQVLDPATGESRPFLDVSRPPVRTASGQVFALQASRDDTVWFVEVSTSPCQ
jgi:hypothetical protein